LEALSAGLHLNLSETEFMFPMSVQRS